jgi:hypothetical protein
MTAGSRQIPACQRPFRSAARLGVLSGPVTGVASALCRAGWSSVIWPWEQYGALAAKVKAKGLTPLETFMKSAVRHFGHPHKSTTIAA